MNKEENKINKKERGRPAKDNVQLNLRYPRKLDELIRAQGEPGEVIIPILAKHFEVEL